MMREQKNEAVFRRWLDEHLGLMLKVVRAFATSPQNQEDLFQETLMQLWRSIASFKGDSKETTWIYRVAFNTALAWNRSEKKQRLGHETLLRFDPPAIADASRATSALEQEKVDLLYAAIRQLPKVDASLALMLLDGLSYREMAVVLGISENNVGVKLNRIRKELAQHIERTTK
jgi:RNA polymerase sigma-70 factor (ECF subfamily)